MQLEMIMSIIFNSCIIFLACLGYKKNSKHIEKLLVQSSSLWSKTRAKAVDKCILLEGLMVTVPKVKLHTQSDFCLV